MGEALGFVDVEVLGPLRVRDAGGIDVTPSGALQRRLLALLVLRRGHAVSVDAAIDALWPTDIPADPVAALQNQLSRLRRSVPVKVESMAGGYRLDPTGVLVDADRLTTRLTRPADRDAAAVAEIEALLARWSGPAYVELQDTDDGRAEAVRLDEVRVHREASDEPSPTAP